MGQDVLGQIGDVRPNVSNMTVGEILSRLPDRENPDGNAEGFQEKDFRADEALGNSWITL
jgi:hypothetical protein